MKIPVYANDGQRIPRDIALINNIRSMASMSISNIPNEVPI